MVSMIGGDPGTSNVFPIDRDLPIGQVDVGIGLQHTDRLLETGFNQRSSDPIGGIALPGKEDVMRHGLLAIQ